MSSNPLTTSVSAATVRVQLQSCRTGAKPWTMDLPADCSVRAVRDLVAARVAAGTDNAEGVAPASSSWWPWSSARTSATSGASVPLVTLFMAVPVSEATPVSTAPDAEIVQAGERSMNDTATSFQMTSVPQDSSLAEAVCAASAAGACEQSENGPVLSLRYTTETTLGCPLCCACCAGCCCGCCLAAAA